MAYLGDIGLVSKPVDVMVEDLLDRSARVRRPSVLSLDVYGSEDAPRFDHRVAISSNDGAGVRTTVDIVGYVPGGEFSKYVPPVVRQCLTGRWHEGRELRRFGGRLLIHRVRCPTFRSTARSRCAC